MFDVFVVLLRFFYFMLQIGDSWSLHDTIQSHLRVRKYLSVHAGLDMANTCIWVWLNLCLHLWLTIHTWLNLIELVAWLLSLKIRLIRGLHHLLGLRVLVAWILSLYRLLILGLDLLGLWILVAWLLSLHMLILGLHH